MTEISLIVTFNNKFNSTKFNILVFETLLQWWDVIYVVVDDISAINMTEHRYDGENMKLYFTWGSHAIDISKVPIQEKKEEIWLSPMTKAPTPTVKSKMQYDNTKAPPKTSITQGLRTNLGRSVRVTLATQLVQWLNPFAGSQPSH